MSSETRIGTVVGRYRLESLIGRGGMSVIYLAEQLQLGRKVALKLLAPQLALDERFRERFLRESQLASTIEHPNIIQVYDAGEEDEVLYIAMRYVDGPSLKELIAREGRLGVGRAIYILEQIASALDVAHRKGLVHRDIKPANILLDESSDHAFLTDFGVAKQTTSSGLTSTGLFLGTIEYCSPEQIEGRPVDARTDIYGLGCVLVESLTGAPPFEHDTEIALMHAHLSAPPPVMTARRHDLPPGLNAVVSQALAKDPDDRYQTAGEFAGALREAAMPSRRTTTSAPVVGLADFAEPAVEPPATAAHPAAPTPPGPTPAASPPVAPPPPPAAGGDQAGPPAAGQPVRSGRRRPVALIAAVAVVLGLAGVLAAVLATQGGSKPAGAAGSVAMTTGQGTAGATGTSMGMTTAEGTTGASGTGMDMTTGQGTPVQRLAAYISAQTAWSCSPGKPLHGAMKADVCSTKVPERLKIDIFDSRAMLTEAYDVQLKKQHGLPRGTGRCSATSWHGEGPWVHGQGEPGGRYFCYLDIKDGSSHLVWTSTLGIPTIYDARYASPNHRNLFYWWMNIRHDLA